jgi:hypothetical protein
MISNLPFVFKSTTTLLTDFKFSRAAEIVPKVKPASPTKELMKTRTERKKERKKETNKESNNQPKS